MVNLLKHITSFELSQELCELGIIRPIYIGSYGYDKIEKILYLVTDINGNELSVWDLNLKKIINIGSDKICKAYFASEISDMIPLDYTHPMKFSEGWSPVLNNGDVMLLESSEGFYETEVEALAKYMIWFIETRHLKLEDLFLS